MTSGSDTERHRTPASDRRPADEDQESAFLDEIGAGYAELRKAFREYLAIKISSLKLSFWKTVVAAASVMLGVAFAIAFVVTAVVFAFSGLAGWLGEVTSKPYLGSLLAGLLGLLLVGVAFMVARGVLLKKASGTKGVNGRECAS